MYCDPSTRFFVLLGVAVSTGMFDFFKFFWSHQKRKRPPKPLSNVPPLSLSQSHGVQRVNLIYASLLPTQGVEKTDDVHDKENTDDSLFN